MHDPEAPDVELYVLPSLDDLEYWDRHQAAGLHQPAPEPPLPGTGWQRLNLADPEYAIPPAPPEIHGLLYANKRHVLSGPPESAKTLIAYWLLLQALETGAGVAILDFEMGPVATRRMLTDLGATEALLPLIAYYEPEGPPATTDIDNLLAARTDYVLIDSAVGAYDLSGLDDNSRKDAETWGRTWIEPLFKVGIATITLDHVTKNAEGRGKFTIGSERKTGKADVHLGMEALKTLTRGGTGIVKITAHKDRGAYMQRPTVAMVELASDPESHNLTVHVRPAEPTDNDTGFRPTIYMERVSLELGKHDEPRSQTQLEEAIKGRSTYVRDALEVLVNEGYVSLQTGKRNAKMYAPIKPFRKDNDDPVPTPSHPVPDAVVPPRPTPSPPYRGTGVAGDEENTPTPSPEIDVYDPTIQHLLDDDIPW